jgi:hypothetical protein
MGALREVVLVGLVARLERKAVDAALEGRGG